MTMVSMNVVTFVGTGSGSASMIALTPSTVSDKGFPVSDLGKSGDEKVAWETD